MGRHVLEVAGSRVVIEDGEIVSVTDPLTLHCPLRSKLYGIRTETVESVRQSVEFYIKEWGMFTPDRVVRTESYPVSFGVSEIFASGLEHDILDCVVTVCEGAGTVILANPQVVEGIGAHMTGLIETSPEPAIIRKLLENDVTVLSTEDARMEQAAGVIEAREMGYERIGVTITGHNAWEGTKIRGVCDKIMCAIASVHNTGISKEAAHKVASCCDLVTSCASKWTREIVAQKAIMQLGVGIPVFVLTPLGKELALARLRTFPDPLIVGTGKIPMLNEHQPYPLR